MEATKCPWWLTASGVVSGPNALIAASGTMVSAAVATAAPVEMFPRPVLASWLAAWLRAVSAATAEVVAAAALPTRRPADTVPATALVDWAPRTPPAAVLT